LYWKQLEKLSIIVSGGEIYMHIGPINELI
jgi:hypothetical protein